MRVGLAGSPFPAKVKHITWIVLVPRAVPEPRMFVLGAAALVALVGLTRPM